MPGSDSPRSVSASLRLAGRRLVASRNFWPLVALFALLCLSAFLRPDRFILFQDGRLRGTLSQILIQGSTVMLLATGMTLVIATAGIDLSVGSVMAIAGAVAAVFLTRPSPSMAAAVLLALAVATAAGLWNGLLVAHLRLQPIVATLILLVAGRGIAQFITGGLTVTFQHGAFRSIGTGAILMIPVPVLIVACVAGCTLAATRKTVVGLYVEAVGNNETASRLSGIRPGLVKMLVYGFSGLCAGAAGLIETAYISVADVNRCGQYIELDAILAVVIGGTAFSGGRANVAGSLVGALIMQALTTAIQMMDVPAAYILMVKAITVVTICAFSSERFRSLVRGIAPRVLRADGAGRRER